MLPNEKDETGNVTDTVPMNGTGLFVLNGRLVCDVGPMPQLRREQIRTKRGSMERAERRGGVQRLGGVWPYSLFNFPPVRRAQLGT